MTLFHERTMTATAESGGMDSDTVENASGCDETGHHLVNDGHVPNVSPASLTALRLWTILSRAHAAIAVHAAADVAQHGLTLAEFGIIEALYHRGSMLLGEVQKRILVSSGGITFLVDRLVAKGLVERRSCPSDRRARYAALTNEGESLVARIFPSHADALTSAMSALSTDQQREAGDMLKALGLEAAAQTPQASSPQKRCREG